MVRKEQHALKRSFFSSSDFEKLVEKPGLALTVTPNAEDGVTFNSVPSTERGLRFSTYVTNAITSFFPKLSN